MPKRGGPERRFDPRTPLTIRPFVPTMSEPIPTGAGGVAALGPPDSYRCVQATEASKKEKVCHEGRFRILDSLSVVVLHQADWPDELQQFTRNLRCTTGLRSPCKPMCCDRCGHGFDRIQR